MVSPGLSEPARAARTSTTGGDLKTELYCPPRSGGWKSELKVSAELTSAKASPLSMEMTVSCLCPHRVIPLCVWVLKGHPSYWIRAQPYDLNFPFKGNLSPNTVRV